MNPKELKAAMKRNDDTQEKLAEALGLQTSGVSERINGRIQFRRNEIDIIRQRYNLSDADTIMIFFADDVSCQDAERRKN